MFHAKRGKYDLCEKTIVAEPPMEIARELTLLMILIIFVGKSRTFLLPNLWNGIGVKFLSAE